MSKLALVLVLWLGLISCGGEEEEPIKEPTPSEVFLASVCTDDDPCYPWQIDLEAKRYSFELLKEMNTRFTKPEQIDEAYAWIKAQPKVISADLNKEDPYYLQVSFRVKGMTRMTFNFRTTVFMQSENNLDLNQLKLERPDYETEVKKQALGTMFSSPSKGVFTTKSRFDRKALFLIPQYQVFNSSVTWEDQDYISIKMSHDNFKENAFTYKTELLVNKNILSVSQFQKISEGTTNVVDYNALTKAWVSMVDTYIKSWKDAEYIFYIAHGTALDKDLSFKMNDGKIKWKGNMAIDFLTVEDGFCEAYYDGFENKYRKLGEKSSIDEKAFFDEVYSMPMCGSTQELTYYSNGDSVTRIDTPDKTLHQVMHIDTRFLIKAGVLPLKNQSLSLVSCNIGEYGIPLDENSAKNTSIFFDRSVWGPDVVGEFSRVSLSTGKSPSDLFKSDEFYRTIKREKKIKYERLYKESSPGIRFEETMTLFAPGWGDIIPYDGGYFETGIKKETWPDIQNIEPKFNAQNKMTLDVPVYVVGPWDEWCELSKPDIKFFIEGQDVVVEKAQFLESTLKQPTKHRGQFVMRLTLNKHLKVEKAFELYAQYYYTSKAAGFCPRTDTVARARAIVLDPNCPTWSASAGDSTFAGNQAVILGGLEFHTLQFEILSRVTEEEEVGTGITGNAFLYLDGRADVFLTDQNTFWSTETPLTWIGGFDSQQRMVGSISGQITELPLGGAADKIVPFHLEFKTMPVDEAAAKAHCVNK